MCKNNDFIHGFLNRNQKILDKIYQDNYGNIEKYVINHGGQKKDAEDIFHDALLLLFVKLKNEKIQIKSFDRYLFVVCKNIWKRNNSINRVTNINVIPLVSEEIERANFQVENNQWELYKEKFEQLSTQCKEILHLVFNKTSYEDIVKKYAYSSQSVARQRVFKCKARLIKLIKKDSRYTRLKKR